MDYAVNVDPEMLATMSAAQGPAPAPAAAPTSSLSPAAQSFLDRIDAYEQQKRDEGYEVRRSNIVGPDGDMNAAYESLAAQLDKGLSPADLQITELGHAFTTNKGKPAKTKANPSGVIYASPGTKYRLTNEQGQNAVLVEGEGQTALDEIHRLASGLSETEKKKADWKVEVYEPGNNKWRPLADDDPPGDIIGKLAKIGLPIVGGILAGPLGAALGSAAGGTIAGDSIGSILKSAGLAGVTTAIGGQVFGGGLGGGAVAANPFANSIAQATAGVNSILGSGAGSVLGSGAGALAGGGAAALGGLADDIVVQGIRGASSALPAAIAGGGSAALGSAGAALASGGGGSSPAQQPTGDLPTDIVVTGAPAAPPLDPGVLAGGAGVIGGGAALGAGGGAALGAGGGGPLTTDAQGVTQDPNTIAVTGQPTAPPLDPGVLAGGAAVGAGVGAANSLGGNMAANTANELGPNPTLSQIVDYLQAAGLLTGVLGDLLGGGGGGNGAKIPAGWGSSALGGVFTKPLPTASLPGVNGRTTRLMPPQDWTKYGMRPEQSFWSNVPSTYTPPPAGQYDVWGN